MYIDNNYLITCIEGHEYFSFSHPTTQGTRMRHAVDLWNRAGCWTLLLTTFGMNGQWNNENVDLAHDGCLALVL